jgi:hypothetical protein
MSSFGRSAAMKAFTVTEMSSGSYKKKNKNQIMDTGNIPESKQKIEKKSTIRLRSRDRSNFAFSVPVLGKITGNTIQLLKGFPDEV